MFPVAGFIGSFFGGILPILFANLADVTLDSPIPYRNALLVAAAFELLAVAAMWQADEVVDSAISTDTSHESSSPPPYRLIFLFTLVMLLMVAGEWTMRVYFNVYLDSVLSIHTTLIGTLSAGALFMGLFALLSPQAAARWGRNRVVFLGLMGVFVAFLPLIFIQHWLAVGLGYMILIGAVSLSNPTFLVFSQSVVTPRWRNAIASSMSMAVGLGVAITSFGGGYIIAAFGYQTLFILGAAAGLIGALIVWRFFPREQAEFVPVPDAMD
jgi:predicted MFS family arabinose efflux permease